MCTKNLLCITSLHAAGADIKEMSERTYMECYKSNMFDSWENVSRTNKPVIAAVNGTPHASQMYRSPSVLLIGSTFSVLTSSDL